MVSSYFKTRPLMFVVFFCATQSWRQINAHHWYLLKKEGSFCFVRVVRKLLQNSLQVHHSFVKSLHCSANINSSTEVTKHSHIITTSYSSQLFIPSSTMRLFLFCFVLILLHLKSKISLLTNFNISNMPAHNYY